MYNLPLIIPILPSFVIFPYLILWLHPLDVLVLEFNIPCFQVKWIYLKHILILCTLRVTLDWLTVHNEQILKSLFDPRMVGMLLLKYRNLRSRQSVVGKV